MVQIQARTSHLNLAGPPPDIVILAMSGRCGPPCAAPRDNWDYLAARGTVDVLAQVFEARGYRVQVASYSDNVLAQFQSKKVTGEQQGYVALVRDFDRIIAAWFGRPPPAPPAPRLVLLGHSHGAVWLHLLARNNQYVPVALQIDLDGNCGGWSLDHARAIAQAQAAGGPLALKPGEFSALDACQRIQVAGRWTEAKDVVWPNILQNLEVQSKRRPAPNSANNGWYINYLFDLYPNMRPDGSETGITRLLALHEDHSSVSYPGGDAMNWVLQQAGEVANAWAKADGRVPLPPVPLRGP